MGTYEGIRVGDKVRMTGTVTRLPPSAQESNRYTVIVDGDASWRPRTLPPEALAVIDRPKPTLKVGDTFRDSNDLEEPPVGSVITRPTGYSDSFYYLRTPEGWKPLHGNWGNYFEWKCFTDGLINPYKVKYIPEDPEGGSF